MFLMPYRLPPEVEEELLDVHVTNVAFIILAEQRQGWSYVHARRLTGTENVRLHFRRIKNGS